jgi:hypothetical protein
MGQHKRNHVLARAHWRDQAARLVAEVVPVQSYTENEHWLALACGLSSGRCTTREAARIAVRRAVSANVLAGGSFDVALVRSRCEELVAEAERRAIDRVVFIDWTRAQGPKGSLATGLGPENREPGAFALPPCCRLESSVHVCPKSPIGTYSACDCGDPRSFAANPACATCSGSGFTPRGELYEGPCPDCRGIPADFYRPGCLTCRGESPRGGWPGRLAREFGWAPCSACEGRCRIERLEMKRPAGSMVLADGSVSQSYTATRVRERCVACKGRGRIRKTGISTGVAAGPGLARTAQRLLDTLDGRCPWAPRAKAQPSQCRACGGAWLNADAYRLLTEPELVGLAECVERMSTMSARDAFDVEAEVFRLMCGDCRGTGHNLAGFLPEFDWGDQHTYVDGVRTGGHIRRHRPDDRPRPAALTADDVRRYSA